MSKKIFPLNLAENTEKLCKLILDNPNLPIVVIAGSNACGGEDCPTYCSQISIEIAELLDCEVPYMEEVETDHRNFEEQIEEWLWNEIGSEFTYPPKITEEQFQNELIKEKAKYEQYWKKAIVITADN